MSEPTTQFKPGKHNYASSCNACRQCTPLGACLVFKGIEGAIPYLHGSQGCATYIRRYLISHFREPMDIASSSFSEVSAIFGGEKNFKVGLANIMTGYKPRMIGIATTCLSETIGEDVPSFLHRVHREYGNDAHLPELVHVSTPSYTGSHADGFHEATRAVVQSLCKPVPKNDRVGIFPGLISPADIRYLYDCLDFFGSEGVILPDYSETLDGGAWESYHKLTPGGTKLEDIGLLGGAQAVFDFSCCYADKQLAGSVLHDKYALPRYHMPLPIGIDASDRWMNSLAEVSGRAIPKRYQAERARLIDSYVDAHKYVSGRTVAVFGEADLTLALTGFLHEIGMKVTLVGCGGRTAHATEALESLRLPYEPELHNGCDFRDIEKRVSEMKPDMLIGNSKGYTMSRKLDIPLLRVGFPIHDRFGGARQQLLGYSGTQILFDEIVNAVMQGKQEASPVGYTYI